MAQTAKLGRGSTWALALSCAVGFAAACGGDGETVGGQSFGGNGGGAADSGLAGSAGSAAAGGNINVDGAAESLTVDPPTATLSRTSRSATLSQAFKASLDGAEVPASWTLSSYDFGSIASDGTFTAAGLSAARLTVTARYGDKTGTAQLILKVSLRETVSGGAGDPGPSPGNDTALGGAPTADPGPSPSKLLYPYDRTVMPRGLLAPLIQFEAGSIAPEDGQVKLVATDFAWTGVYRVNDPTRPRFTIPQDVWDAATRTAAGGALDVEVTKAAAGVAYGPMKIKLDIAPGSLKGAVYYMTYETPRLGLWSVKPGARGAPTQLKAGCVVCHSVSSNGTRLSTGAEVNQQSAESGAYVVGSDGTATQFAQSPGVLGGDTRGLSFGVWTPDGKYVTRSRNNFWGGVDTLAFRADVAGSTLTQATVIGMTDVNALLPSFSHDGRRYAFVSGDTTSFGAESRALNLMDVSIDDAAGETGTLTFTGRRTLVDNTASGRVIKFPTFLPNPDLVVVQESTVVSTGYQGMLPTAAGDDGYGLGDGRLWFVDIARNAHIELAKLNAGNVPLDADKNFEPFSLPSPAGGYYWIVFTSIREYGNVYRGGEARKQLWVAAITPNAAGGVDPSHPPFYLPNQTESKNERGFWALEPCKSTGASCESGDECCDGRCRPNNAADAGGAKVCSPPDQSCAQLEERCTTNADCCGAAQGVECLNGVCSTPVPQ